MPHEALNDLALAVLRYDQGLRQFQREHLRYMEAKAGQTVLVAHTPDLDELYEDMLDLARSAVKDHPLPRA